MEVGEVIKKWKIVELNVTRDKKGFYSKCECINCGSIKIINNGYMKQRNTFCEICRQKYLDSFIGMKYGRLLVISYSHITENHMLYYNCICDCGNSRKVCLSKLKNGETKSCGCYAKEISYNNLAHGMSGTRIYTIYNKIKGRCYFIENKAYSNYGGRGIKMSNEWYDSFINFYNDMYKSYEEHVRIYGEKDTTIERVDVNGNYCKENCTWATCKEQANNKQNTLWILAYGVYWNVYRLSEFTGIPGSSIRYYYHNGNLYDILNNIQASRYRLNVPPIKFVNRYPISFVE